MIATIISILIGSTAVGYFLNKMGKLVNFVTKLHKSTKRNYLERMMNQKVYCMKKARKFEYDYWDGKRTVDQSQQVGIDFLGAVNEMENLDHKFERNFIGFQNLRN